MATKKVRCTLCDGSGFVTRIHKTKTSCGIARATCPRCHGTGTKAVPVTNADRIRAMSDEEIAELILDWVQTGACNDFGVPVTGNCNGKCVECIVEWLKQTAEEK